MRKHVAGLVAFVLMFFAGFSLAWAEEKAAPTTEAASLQTVGMAQLYFEPSRNKAVQGNLFGQLLYVERELDKNGWSVFSQMYNDHTFRSAFVGLAKKFGDFQLAVAGGPGQDSAGTHPMINSWAYWSSGNSEGLMYVEAGKQMTPYFKGHLQEKFENGMIAGVYGQSNLGVGPMVGYYVTEKVSIKFSMPVALRGDTAAIMIFSFDF